MTKCEYEQLVAYYRLEFDQIEGEQLIYSSYDKNVDRGSVTNATGKYSIVENLIKRFDSVKLLGYSYNSMEATSKRGNVALAYYSDPG
ncbi:hypothetical protein ABG067_007946, partial [Albugo candida]